jgi:hypothetical protein
MSSLRQVQISSASASNPPYSRCNCEQDYINQTLPSGRVLPMSKKKVRTSVRGLNRTGEAHRTLSTDIPKSYALHFSLPLKQRASEGTSRVPYCFSTSRKAAPWKSPRSATSMP